jgi:hypothetical protein
MQSHHFEILVDGVPYVVNAKPYAFNNETRFTVNFNGSEDYVFLWDATLGRLAAIGDESIDIPVNLEEAVAERLQSAV